ncbi:MAG: DEAD/DEAH box helicase [Acidimicrobiia bacterium]|nr:MAG: DEAD/DEAH box helicase [Acidimicrobiia bacterium]
MSTATLDAFLSGLPFLPDGFQLEALHSVEQGRSVLVTAPTGAGKTLVADGSIAICVAGGERAFYTTPIKALSNQKFNDLSADHGRENVGLLTGDNVINGDAPIIVMTTEVLRNMIYEGSPALDDLGLVILDEVHYLSDRHRGSVWEEIIIHLPKRISLVCLSATIANPEEFTDWVRERRGQCDLVVETERPVPLTSIYMWRDRHRESQVASMPVFGKNGRPNGTIRKMLLSSRGRHRRFSTPRRVAVVRELDRNGLLPCIYFVFSRKGCDQTAQEIADADFDFTTVSERAEIRAVAERHVAHLSTEDLTVLGHERWINILENGVSSHHAGLIPAFKEAVEELFLRGLVKVVVATETLALGINMPARTVILDSLSKFDGEGHELLKPSDYTQLTGRAGRRGIDTEGTAVVLFSSYIPFDRVTTIAAKGSSPLHSSFSPTYNMAVNLVARYDKRTAHELLDASFANFSIEHRSGQLQSNLEDRRGDLETFRKAAECDRGDIWESDDTGPNTFKREPNTQLLQPGAVISVANQSLVLLGRSWGGGHPKLSLTGVSGERHLIRTRDLPANAQVLGEIKLPTPQRSQDPVYRREVGAILETFVPKEEPSGIFPSSEAEGVYGCQDIDTHLKWAERAKRTERDIRRLERRIAKSNTNDISLEFDNLMKVLNATGYTTNWSLSSRGESLRRLYNELDLLLAEALRTGVFSGSSAAEFAALISMFTYQARGGKASEIPRASFAAESITDVTALAEQISERERHVGLVETRYPDFGLVDSMYAWASGLELVEIFDTDDLRAGDFVRSARQLLDLLRQIRDGFSAYRVVAAEAIKLVDRGIVEAGAPR